MPVSLPSPPTSRSLPSRAIRIVPIARKAIVKNAPLLDTEEVRAYGEYIRVLARQLTPNDVLGWLLLRDFIDCDVEVQQMRTMKAAVVVRAKRRAAAEVGYPGRKQDTLLAAIDAWEAKHPEPRRNKFDIDEDEDCAGESQDGVDGKTGDKSPGNKDLPIETSKQPKPPKKSKRERQAEMADAFLDSLEAYERIDHLLGRAVAARKESLRLFTEHVARARLMPEAVIEAECTDMPNAEGSDALISPNSDDPRGNGCADSSTGTKASIDKDTTKKNNKPVVENIYE
jgi:hypothetical protein